MSFNTHARCDWCEGVALVGDEDELLDEGWLAVRFGDETIDFCTLVCLGKWAGSDSAVERVAQAAKEDEDG